MDDLSDLYQDIILGHNKRPHHYGELNPHTHEAEGYNPLCGDRLCIQVREKEGSLEAAGFTGEGCAISKASASIMTDAVKGLDREGVAKKIGEVLELLTGREEPVVDLMEQGDIAALAGVRKFPPRVKCATLAWHTLAAALSEESRAVSTE